MDAPGRNSSLYFSFERIYLDTEDKAIEREEERTKIACTRRITFGHRKVASASLAVECVCNCICASGSRKLLNFHVINLPYRPQFPVIRMRYPFVHHLLLPYILRPTKLIRDKLLQIKLAVQIEAEWKRKHATTFVAV